MLRSLPNSNWNFKTAAHLLNRAGFGGTPAQIEKLAAMGLEAAVDQLVDFEKIPDDTPAPDWAQPDPDRAERLAAFRQAPPEQRREMFRAAARQQRAHFLELRQWWLERMARGPRPLQEKLTLFWHGHFATSALKVRDAFLMWRQNEIFRQHGAGDWLTLLSEVSKDPAMLIWLDQAQSRQQHPNENFAREVMELFTLGEGHYTEKDITEAARALTGWSLDRGRQHFFERPRFHDTGTKTFLGRSGNFSGDDLLRIILDQPQASKFITAKLWTFFVSENPPAPLVESLAGEFRASGQNFRPLLRRIFLSQEFYADNVIRSQVKSPVQWLVEGVRQLERPLPPPQMSTNALRLLGQDLFLPPNVKGWDGGLSWITTNNLLNRYNLAEVLVFGLNPFPFGGGNPKSQRRIQFRAGQRVLEPLDVIKLLEPTERRHAAALLAALEKRLLQSELRPNQVAALKEYLDKQPELDQETIRHAIRLIMATPEYQLT